MSRTFNKLVRDKIPQIIIGNGEKPITRVLDEKEYMVELIKKLKEEVTEFEEALFGSATDYALEPVSVRSRGTQANRTAEYVERVPQGSKPKVAKKPAGYQAQPGSGAAGAKCVQELADIKEVTIAIREAMGIHAGELEDVRRQKAAKNGRFKKRIFLEGVE